MLKLLYSILISILLISCVENSNCPPIDKDAIKQKIKNELEANLDSVFTSNKILMKQYQCRLQLVGGEVKVTNEHVHNFVQWYTKFPKKIDLAISKGELLLDIHSIIPEQKMTDEKMNSHLKYLSSLEEIIHMTIGTMNGFPVTRISFYTSPNEKNDSSYVKIGINELKY